MLTTDTGENSADDGRFRLAMQSSGIGMAIVDLDGRWLEVNPAFERMFGYKAADIVGHTADEFTHAEDVGVSKTYFAGLVDGSIPMLDAEKRYLRRDGSTLWAHVNVAAMRDPDGRALYLIAQLLDVTKQRQAEQALQALNDSLEQRVDDRMAELAVLAKQQELFAYGVSHDLRAPLRAIDGFSAQLASHMGEGIDETARDYLDRIRGAAARMASLIDSLLELSRASRAELRSTSVDVSLLADWAGTELIEADPERVARIDVQPGMQAQGDERQLKLLFDKLLHNAWKFSGDCERVEITVSGEREDNSIVLSIRDRGRGFDMCYADKLFEPFQRLHGPEHGGGNGLGLAIAQRIVERHRGRVWAQSEPGAGSTFFVQLPAAPDAEPAP